MLDGNSSEMLERYWPGDLRSSLQPLDDHRQPNLPDGSETAAARSGVFHSRHSDRGICRHNLERTPIGRFGAAEEVAEVVNYLAAVTWPTGQTLFLDGGFMATGLGYFAEARDHLSIRRHR